MLSRRCLTPSLLLRRCIFVYNCEQVRALDVEEAARGIEHARLMQIELDKVSFSIYGPYWCCLLLVFWLCWRCQSMSDKRERKKRETVSRWATGTTRGAKWQAASFQTRYAQAQRRSRFDDWMIFFFFITHDIHHSDNRFRWSFWQLFVIVRWELLGFSKRSKARRR